MNRKGITLLGATALIAIATPALADKSDRLYTDLLRDKIAAARAEPGVAENGGAELNLATERLSDLDKKLDKNDTAQAKSVTEQIDALIETARIRARIAGLKVRNEQLGAAKQAETQERVANAEANAAQAQAKAATATAEADRLRQQMRDYQLKQTQLGATLVLQDVVFETGKADLKAGSAERLRPLANYLQANPNVKVRIDGHTDAQGGAAFNQALSQARARSVAAALSGMGVDAGRIEAVGHGLSMPVADNKTAAGRQQNRRVEVTLIGQQANAFAG